MRHALQLLRDIANKRSEQSALRGDSDSADAWERIGLLIDDCQVKATADWRTIEARAWRDDPNVLAELVRQVIGVPFFPTKES